MPLCHHQGQSEGALSEADFDEDEIGRDGAAAEDDDLDLDQCNQLAGIHKGMDGQPGISQGESDKNNNKLDAEMTAGHQASYEDQGSDEDLASNTNSKRKIIGTKSPKVTRKHHNHKAHEEIDGI